MCPDHGSNQYLLHWQAYSLLLSHQGKSLILTGNDLFSCLPQTHPSDLPSFLIGCSSFFWLCLLNSKPLNFQPLGPFFLLPSIQFSSVQFSRSVMSDSLWHHESQHARPPCPSPTPGVYSYSCPSSQWCHQDISSSVIPFSSCPQSPPASGSFPISQLFTWSGQNIGVSASASVLPMNIQGMFL